MIIVIRTMIIYVVVIFSLRLMGKKQIGELDPSELAVAIMISELASIPLETKDVPLLSGIIPVLILAFCEIIVSMIAVKSLKIRKVFTGVPSLIVEKGILKEEVLKDTRFTTDDLLEEMRISGITNISEIQYAFLETNGQVSFILNKKDSPPTASDLSLNVSEDELPFSVINKGYVNKENLKLIKRDEEWLNNKLIEKNLNKKDILLLLANHQDIKYFQLRKGAKN